MRYKEVILVTDKEFHGAYFREKEKGFGETLGCRLGKDIAEREKYSVDIREDGSRYYSLEVVAFSPNQWQQLVDNLEAWLPSGVLEYIKDEALK